MHTLRKQVLALFAAFSTVGGVSAPMMQTAIVQAAQTTTTATINLNIYYLSASETQGTWNFTLNDSVHGAGTGIMYTKTSGNEGKARFQVKYNDGYVDTYDIYYSKSGNDRYNASGAYTMKDSFGFTSSGSYIFASNSLQVTSTNFNVSGTGRKKTSLSNTTGTFSVTIKQGEASTPSNGSSNSSSSGSNNGSNSGSSGFNRSSNSGSSRVNKGTNIGSHSATNISTSTPTVDDGKTVISFPSLSKKNIHLKKGKKKTIKATNVKKIVKVKSSKKSVASVKKKGKKIIICGKKKGKATLKATVIDQFGKKQTLKAKVRVK